MPTRREILQRLDELEPPIRRRFLEAVRDAVDAASVGEIERMIRDGDTEAIGRAIILGDEALASGALSEVTESMRDAFVAGGRFEQAQARIRFDVRNVRAERWLRDQSSTFVTRISNQQREAIRVVVESGTRLGRNPRATALDIVGRIDRTGRRRGGIVGLADNQAKFVSNAREQLLSGDSAQMRDYFNRTRRDRRFDGIVRRAIEAGRPVAAADVDRLTARYSDRLLALRGETIARTEAMQGFNAARDEAWDQAMEQGVVSRENVRKVWRSAGDGRTRDTHAAMSGQTVMRDEPFVSPSGARLMFPGDTSLGAPADEIIDCRCTWETRVDHIGQQAASEAA